MNKDKIIEIRKMLSFVSAGPWISFVEGRDHDSGSSFIRTGDKDYEIEFIRLKEDDQDFIALMRNALPELLEEINRLEDILDRNNIPY